jgi:limonene-1,2-epoxide hydrolase
MFPPVHGKAAFEQFFRGTFAMLPDLTATVQRWGGDEHTVYIESDCMATVGRTAIQFRVCDAFVLSEGLIVERHAYFDPSPLVRAFLVRPWLWPRLMRGLLEARREAAQGPRVPRLP